VRKGGLPGSIGGVEQLRPRALIFDLLGDYVRYSGGEIRLKALVALGEQLGVATPTMRVVVARMREEGWLNVRRDGRESIYSLTQKCLITLNEGRRRIFRGKPGPWSGEWSMVIYTVPESDRPTREQLRRDLSWLGFGPLAPATWVSPHPMLDRVADIGAALPAARLELVTMRARDIGADRSIAARCWDLDELNTAYADFIRSLRLKLPRYRAGLPDNEAMAERIVVIQAYRRFPSRDPGLPLELQPAGWLGEQARVLFEEVHDLLGPGARAHYESVVGSPVREDAPEG
jgi:phenylacetic acid degradation operon negative regulatory protein